MKDDQIRAALLDIDEAIRGKDFEQWRREFVAANLHHFTYDDENKLVYTEIHKEFEAGVEERMLQALPKGFDFVAFQEGLIPYVEGPGKSDEATGKAVTMLLQVADFDQFKTMMLFYKREKDEEESKHAGEQLVGIRTTGGDVAMLTEVRVMSCVICLLPHTRPTPTHDTSFLLYPVCASCVICLLPHTRPTPTHDTSFLLYPVCAGRWKG
jgi:hypothetical protein